MNSLRRKNGSGDAMDRILFDDDDDTVPGSSCYAFLPQHAQPVGCSKTF